MQASLNWSRLAASTLIMRVHTAVNRDHSERTREIIDQARLMLKEAEVLIGALNEPIAPAHPPRT